LPKLRLLLQGGVGVPGGTGIFRLLDPPSAAQGIAFFPLDLIDP